MAKPPTAAWIQRERRRKRRDDGKPWRVADLRERLRLMGIEVTEQTIRVWEGNLDRRPSADALDALERIFGTQAPNRDAGPSTMGEAGVVTALNELTEAVRAQTKMIEDRLLTQSGAWDGYADGLQQLLALLVKARLDNGGARARQRVEKS